MQPDIAVIPSVRAHILWPECDPTDVEGGARLGVLIIVLLAIAWAIVLVPSLARPRFETSPIDGVRSFERSMGILANTRQDRQQVPGRWVMVPKGIAAVVSRRQRVMLRRRRIFTRLLIAAAVTFLLGVVPALRSVWIAHVVLDAVLVGYVFQLRRWRMRELQRRRVVHRLPPEPDQAERERAAGED